MISKILLAEILSDYVGDYLESIGVNVRRSGKKYTGRCPIHSGNNCSAFCVFTEGHTTKCNWVCFTHKCEKGGNDIVTLTRKVLGCSEKDAVGRICDFLQIKPEDVKSNPQMEERMKFIATSQRLNRRAIKGKGWPREIIRKSLGPPDYFIERGFDAQVLAQYDVGTSKKFPNRVIVPIYDDTHETMVGYTARNTKPYCDSCEMYHYEHEGCPKTDEQYYNSCKWTVPANFNLHHYLYNYWKAKHSILKERYIVLVEGAGECWRLEENGEHNSLALFGVELSDEQMILLEKSGAYHLFLGLDKDEAGKEASDRIKKQCHRLFNIHQLSFKEKDIGGMNNPQVNELIREIKSKL